ncbi:TB2/DP1/HVA22-related protein family-containing protein [Strongyloides ratti]|uniref:Receptor expression-enhancing protein n=1 Tax=Strongyloides ratti TaxID=34506 RepID=A0A090MZ54_STRRB|nr:TB2/DP1/HVA22-related protein family-containing protein [Strongyloides ratti]CEF68339.1 TB2/DP1/HVA22-related protein family-containing protein [Strongyloides ratti]
MLSALLSRILILTAGTLYPAYRSFKAVRTKNVKEYIKLMMYWICFALFIFIENITDVFVSFWFPFYYETKVLFVFWMLSPWTKGASLLYRKWIHPFLSKHEDEIDIMIERAKDESYRQALSLGQKGIAAAKDIIATAAIRGQERLQKSYSMSDVSNISAPSTRKRVIKGKVSKENILNEEEIDDSEEQRQRNWVGHVDENGRIIEELIEEEDSGDPDYRYDELVDLSNEAVAQRKRRKSKSRSSSKSRGTSIEQMTEPVVSTRIARSSSRRKTNT